MSFDGSIKNVTTVCDTRHTYNLSCRDCMYNGAICDRFKHRYKVKKPYELLDIKEYQERIYNYD